MSDNIYKITDVVGSSTESVEDAVRKAISRTARTVNHLDWFEVKETRGHIENGQVGHWQVRVRIGFKIED